MDAAKQVYDFMDNARVFFLATVEGDQPRVRVYGATLYFENSLYIMAMNHTNAIDQLKANPKAEIAAFKGKQLRLTCKLVEDKRQEVKDAMVAKMPSLKAMGGDNYENCIMLKVTEATATIADMAGHSDTYTF